MKSFDSITAFVTICIVFIFSTFIETKAQVVINEVSSVNYDAIMDENHKRPDWIELYNTSEYPVNLKGWRINDKDDYAGAWQIPDIELMGKSRILLFADGKDYYNSNKFIMEATGKGLFTYSNPDGYRFNYIEIEGDFKMSVRLHSLSNSFDFGSAGLIIREDLDPMHRYFGPLGQRDDRYEVMYVYRDTANTWPKMVYSGQWLNYPNILLAVGRKGNVLIAEIYDIEGLLLSSFTLETDYPEKVLVGLALSSSHQDMQAKASFSDLRINGELFPYNLLKGVDINLSQPGKSYMSDELHTSFSLSRGGETLVLWKPDATIADKIEFPPMYADMSYARIPDGVGVWSYSYPPTPKQVNSNPKKGILPQPKFSRAAGFYDFPTNVQISGLPGHAKIYYTLDCSEPDTTSKVYSGEIITFDSTSTLKAIAYSDGYIPSQIESATYIIGFDNQNMPVVSLTTDEEHFFSKEKGIFENIYNDFEYPCTFEFFDSNKVRFIVNRVGMKIHGNDSRLLGQKSIRLHTRSKYGLSEFDYRFFGDHKGNLHDKLILRNGGQDWTKAFIRDAFASRVAECIDNMISTASRPALSFINGKFWGIYNIRERSDEEFLSIRFGLDEENTSVMESPLKIVNRSVGSLQFILDTAKTFDFENREFYDVLDKYIDIHNMIRYATFNFFIVNFDWRAWNVRSWKSIDLDDRWRFIVHDMDVSFSSSGSSHYSYNMFTDFMNSELFDTLQTWNFNKLLELSLHSTKFRNEYLNTTCDLLNSVLLPARLHQIMDTIHQQVALGVDLHHKRWPESLGEFDEHITLIREFIDKRADFYRQDLQKYFNLDKVIKITLISNYQNACTFDMNSLKELPEWWSGLYFSDIPITLVQNPRKGFKFKYWMINDELIVPVDTLVYSFQDSVTIQAVFEESVEPMSARAVINEIMYNSASFMDSDDWVEFYNPGDYDLDMSSWIFRDDNNSRQFVFPSGAVLPKGGFLVLVRDSRDFKKINPHVSNVYGEFDFGLGSEDMVRLYDLSGLTADSVAYTNRPPWYPEADGSGPSLELLDAFSDNSKAVNWRASYVPGGSPGKANSIVSVEDSYIHNLLVYPNPAQFNANIVFEVDKFGQINVGVFDMFGREIRNLMTGDLSPGTYSTYWDKKDEGGETVSPGLYFIRISDGRQSKIEKLMVH